MNRNDTFPYDEKEAYKTTQTDKNDCPVLKRISYNIDEERMKEIYRTINKKLNGGE